MKPEIKELLLEYSTDSNSSWAIVRNGTVAEFSIVSGDRPRKTFDNNVLQVETQRATLCVNFDDSIQSFVAESGAHGCSPWTQNIYLCIPKKDAKMSNRKKLTHLIQYDDGQDKGELWDLGIGNETLDACIVAKDSETNNLLRQKEGRHILDEPNFLRDLVKHSPVRLFKSKFAFIKVRQKIPQNEEDELEGPHTHLLPPIIKSNKHFQIPIPDDLIPIIQTDPFGSVIDGNGGFHRWMGFDEDKFQNFLRKYGDSNYLSLKQDMKERILSNLSIGSSEFITEEYSNTTKQDLIRITLAQIVCDDKQDITTRRRAFGVLDELKTINTKGLRNWVEHMSPEILD